MHAYMLIGDDDKPIYVGQSVNVKNRLAAHRGDKTVYDALGGRTKREATQRVELVECTDRDDMRATEMRLIDEHRPVLNIAGNPDSYADAERAELLAQHVAKVVAAAPPLTDAQRDRIATILRAGAA